MAQTMIRWALDQPGHHTICLGAKRLEEYRDALAAAAMPPLTEEIRTALEARAATLR
jgi:aryl-alcohol dehydrogenase-like predicted oxidoreductase